MNAGPRPWTCPDCRSTYRIPGADPKSARCSKCRDVLMRVWNQPVPIATPPLPSKRAARPTANVWRPVVRPVVAALPQDLCVVIMGAGLAAWVLFAFAPPAWDLFSYLGLTAAVAAATLWRLRRTPAKPGLIIGVGIGVGIAALLIFGWNDTYDREFLDDDFETTVTYSRWGRTPLFEDSQSRRGKPYFVARGALAPSGKRHGRWYVWAAGSRSEYAWYWYGEIVTEGEWHRRDR